MVGVQRAEEAADNTEDAVPESTLPGCLAVISALTWFSLSHRLLSSSFEKGLATLQQSIRHMSNRQQQLALHDVTRG